ncbi:MAG TPA: GtrA family protein [Caulobacteraceae bacterium]|nr:GtrA family protein [Caulobacteraceae bacterium]
MDSRREMFREFRTAIKFAGVGLVGFAIDAVLLRAGMALGLSPAFARVISLVFAIQTTFAINGLFVFRCLTIARLPRQWAGYILANGFGNLCNYWIFVTLVSLHKSLWSNVYFAMTVGAMVAYSINFAGTRLLVFGKARKVATALSPFRRAAACGPEAPAAGTQPPP